MISCCFITEGCFVFIMMDDDDIPSFSDCESVQSESSSTNTGTASQNTSSRMGSNGPAPDLIPVNMRLSGGEVVDWTASLMTSTSGVSHLDSEELTEADREEKMRLIGQVLELQHTLEDLSSRVDSVSEENLKLRSENQILGQYIENLMAASSVFHSASPKARRRGGPTQPGHQVECKEKSVEEI